jgi:hypothetical protein
LTEAVDMAVTPPTANGDKPLPKRNAPRGMVPMSWLGRTAVIEYQDMDGRGRSTSATILDWCGMGLIVNTGVRMILAWDSVRSIELRD